MAIKMTRLDRRAEDKETGGLRQIPMWARRYAQNRTLPVAVNLVLFLAGFAVFGGLSYLIGWAYKSGERALAGVAIVLLSGFAVWWLWFCFFGAARVMPRIAQRLYRGEGSVQVGETSEPMTHGTPPVGVFVFMFCVLTSVVLGVFGFIPLRHMQPVSAIYTVPFLCYLWAKVGKAGSPFMLLWPALYAIHAILLVAGAPIRFEGPYETLNMLLPVAGYGLVATLAGHIYSRYALRRLQVAAGGPQGHGDEGAGEL